MFSPETFESPGQPVVRNKQLKKNKARAKIEDKSSCKRGSFFEGMGGGYFFVSHWAFLNVEKQEV